jgi:type 1 fimbria pilin
MKIKKCLALLLTMTIVLSISAVSASAKAVLPNDDTVHLNYVQISDVAIDLTASGRTLYVTAGTYGYFDATRCGVTATLQKLSGSSWVRYKVWEATSPSSHPDFVVIDTTCTVTPGQYRLVSSHSVTVGSYTELEGMMSPVRTVS